MATVSVTSCFQRGKRILEISLAATVVPNAATDMAVIPLEGIDRVYVHLTSAVAALTGFAIKTVASGLSGLAADTLYNAASDFLNPAGLLVGASGNLTVLNGAGWFIMDTQGIDTLIINATSGGTATLAIEGGGD